MRNLLATSAIACLSLTAMPIMAQDADSTAIVAPPSADASTVLATVDGVNITLGHVILLRTELPEQYLSAPDDVLFEGILDQLIEQALLGGIVAEEPLEITLTLENERRTLMAGAAIALALGDEPTEEEYQAAYEEAYAEFPVQPEFNASHILVETEDEAKELVIALEEGADFAELAMEKSTGPSGPEGGALGWFGLGQMVGEFEEAVQLLEVGEVSPPVQTQFGWHVLILNDIRETAPPTLEEVRGNMAQRIQGQRIEAKLAELREAATIELKSDGIDPALIKNIDLVIE